MDAREAVCRGNLHRSILAVEVVARIVLALAPAVIDGFLLGAQRGRERDDGARVQVAVRPAVEALADAGREGVVHGRVAERARRAEMRQDVLATLRLDGALEADDGVELQKRDRRLRGLEVDGPRLDTLHDGWR